MITHIGKIALMLAMSHGGQRGGAPKIFTYDSTQLQEWYRASHVNAEPEDLPDGIKKPMRGGTQVRISGNFGGVFNVSGIGESTSQTESNEISVTTNRPLTFSANSFKPLMVGNSSEPGMGSITYSMALFTGTPSHIGMRVSGPVTGTDAGFNGQTLSLTAAQVPANGNLVLVLTRTLTLTSAATGAYKIVGTGNIGVSIN